MDQSGLIDSDDPKKYIQYLEKNADDIFPVKPSKNHLNVSVKRVHILTIKGII